MHPNHATYRKIIPHDLKLKKKKELSSEGEPIDILMEKVGSV